MNSSSRPAKSSTARSTSLVASRSCAVGSGRARARANLHPLVHDHVFAWLVGTAAGRRRLHRLAARHCEQVLNDPLEACWHFARAGDHAEAADLLGASAADLAASGRSERAADLAADLPAAGRLTEDAARQLFIARGDLLVHTERAAEAEMPTARHCAGRCRSAVRAEGGLAAGSVPAAARPGAGGACPLPGRRRRTGEGEDVLRVHLAAVQSAAHLMLSEFAAAVTMAQAACSIADRIEVITPGIATSVPGTRLLGPGDNGAVAGRPAGSGPSG